MEVEFDDESLHRLETDATCSVGDPAIDRGFRKVMQAIRAAVDERDFYAMKSLRFEKLEGARSHERSMRINKQWRLILELVGTAPNKKVRVKKIEIITNQGRAS